MIELKSVSKPIKRAGPFERAELAVAAPRDVTEGAQGSTSAEESRSVQHLVVTGKSGPIRPPFESLIDRDERVRILDTDLHPWRMICALQMRGPNGGGASGTGWFIGPRTLLTAGHCVFSTFFFGGWVSTIEVIPGLNGTGSKSRPFGSVTTTRVSSVDRWVEKEDPDFDIGCIHLDQDMGTQVGWFALGALSPEELQSYLVNISGYPGDRGGDRGAGTEQYHNRNRVVRVSDRRLFYEVDTYSGQSGAPVWIHESEGAPPLAVGIHAYGIDATPTDFGIKANSAPRIIPEVLSKIKEWVEQDGGWPQV